MINLTKGQKAVLIATAVPMAAVGIAGALATFVNMKRVLVDDATALGMVAAGEGATLLCALVCLALTLMAQHTPTVVRAALWLLPVVASGAGVYLAEDGKHSVAMAVTPLAMTAAGEGIALVARRIVAFQTGVDLEQQKRSGLLLWHANRVANGGAIGRWVSKAAVWRLTRQFAATDAQMAVQLTEVQRYRIGEGADQKLHDVLSGVAGKKAAKPVKAPELVSAGFTAPALPPAPAPVAEAPEAPSRAFTPEGDDGFGFIKDVLADAEQSVATDHEVDLLTVAEVAAAKGVSTATVRSWVSRGKLKADHRDSDGRNLFHPLAVADMD